MRESVGSPRTPRSRSVDYHVSQPSTPEVDAGPPKRITFPMPPLTQQAPQGQARRHKPVRDRLMEPSSVRRTAYNRFAAKLG